jgi:endonuclease/exonuclease/phosphatase family metal-dependent hydrolase
MKSNSSQPTPKWGSFAAPWRFHAVLRLAACVLFSAAVFTSTPMGARSPDVGGKRDFAWASFNLYVGGDIEKAIGLDPSDTNYVANLVLTVTGIYNDIVASDPGKRMAAIADEIAARKPDLVSLQELSQILRQTPGDLAQGGSTPATAVVYDYLQLILDALAARGAHYQVASVVAEIDVEMPMLNLATGGLDDVRLIDREAILVRTDLPPGQLRVSNPQSGHFTNILVVPGIGLEVKRGWCSVDVFTRGRTFRYLCTHLETETEPALQFLQAAELLNGPVKVSMPVLLTGDFNADPLHRNGTQTYDQFGPAGFSDAWSVLNPGNPEGGLTFGHDPGLADPTLNFVWRLDLALYRGTCFQPTTFCILDPVIGGPQAPLWPSDHAGIYTEFQIR